MRKRLITAALIILSVAFSGCGMDDFLEEKMFEKSQVGSNPVYLDYKSQVEKGSVDEKGYYTEPTDEIKSGSIHVTFARNNNLNVRYYSDPECREEIDITDSYVNPGDVIYARPTIDRDVSSSMYEFHTFNVCEYDADGKRRILEDCRIDTSKVEDVDTVAIQIPKEFQGTEISLEPLGQYVLRSISLNDYYIDEAGNKMPLDGKWVINGEEYRDDTVNMNPVSSYIISYEYDSNEYFLASSVPECYYSNNDDGIVIFNQREATDETEDYSVELCKYITVALVSGTDRTVMVNGGELQTVKANTELSISGLKYGDKVTLETDKEWNTLESNRELILTKTEKLSSGSYKYTLTVPEKDGQFMFDPSEYRYEHGTIVFKCFGSPVTDKQFLAKESKICYEAGSAEEGYGLPEGEKYIIVTDENETRKQLENIHFIEKIRVHVKLKQPDFGGQILYYQDGRRLVGDEYETYSGSAITMDFEPWEGWKCNYKDGYKYAVTDMDGQTTNVEGVDIDKLFTEDEDHKPKLSVVLDKSVGENLEFEFSASGLDSRNYTYENGWFRNDYKIIDGKTIGTEAPIVISMQNKAIPSQKAIKIVVTRTDTDKNTETAEIRYVRDLTELQDPIYLYDNSEMENTAPWYTAVNIAISIVDVVDYEKPVAAEHTMISVYNADTMQELKDGEILQESQSVIVEISPATGYYIVDGNMSNHTVYRAKMKYAKYLKTIDDLRNSHHARKICQVQLDTSDTFARYTYEINGEEVSGNAELKEGDKLTLRYEITDQNYKLSEGAGGIFGVGKSYVKASGTITITADMDQSKIKKEDFGIVTERKE